MSASKFCYCFRNCRSYGWWLTNELSQQGDMLRQPAATNARYWVTMIKNIKATAHVEYQRTLLDDDIWYYGLHNYNVLLNLLKPGNNLTRSSWLLTNFDVLINALQKPMAQTIYNRERPFKNLRHLFKSTNLGLFNMPIRWSRYSWAHIWI